MLLKICHLYPDLLDLYGDRGNIIALERRCYWRGIDVEITRITLGEQLNFKDWDIVFMGGGSDREQSILFQDLHDRAENLAAAINDGLVMLNICGGLQMMGKYYQTADGSKIPGIEILDLWTVAGAKRLIGNVCIELGEAADTGEGEFKLPTLVGFENHSGQTFLGGLKPLGKVVKGFGNNGNDGMEGFVYKNVFGTYLHGPLLPKNPHFADMLLARAIERRWGTVGLAKLDDSLEIEAHQYIVNRLKQT
ncbi:MAG: glutamine amidotransferase [Peptococcaceae bacterium]|nr:glutamine amidotransferase [Peptococcaceae bacterium]